MDNTIDLMDQAAFLELRATGQATLIQFTWIYERAVDLGGLRRFHHYLARGLLGRRIECSPLPFARDRWVVCHQPSTLDIAAKSRARADVGRWADERAQVPVDPERGPGWHLGVVPLENGGGAVSLVVSHCVADGVAVALALEDAAKGRVRDLGYPQPQSRTRTRALLADARRTARDTPWVVRALFATAGVARRHRHGVAAPESPARETHAAAAPILPSLTIYLDPAEWDSCAKKLGGTANSLFGAFAAKLAERLGRVNDAAVTLAIPVSERTLGDLRANALTSLTIAVDPTRVIEDLGELRAKTKQGLRALQETPNELLQALPLTPLTPKRVARRLTGLAYGDADLPVGCSNLGEIDPTINRPDGFDADYASIRLVKHRAPGTMAEREPGQLFLTSVQLSGKIAINVIAHQPGREISKHDLYQLITAALAAFELSGRIE
jgi:diacylglycerol O-acyltransferase / wax synthase